MSKRMQATARFAAVVILAVLLTGCIKLNLDFTVSSDNTVSGTMVFAFSKQLLQLTGQSAQDLLASSAPVPSSVPGVSAKPYDDGEFAGEEYTFDAVPITEFNSNDPTSPLSIVRTGDTFTVSGVLDLSSGAGVSGASGAIPGLDQALAGADIRISITFPGEVTDTNGAVDGTTVTWSPKIGERLEINATAGAIGSGSSSTSSILLIGLIALAVIAVIVVVALVMKGRRKAASGGDTAEGMTPMTPSEAPAMQAPPSIPPPSMPPPPPPPAPPATEAPPEMPAPPEMSPPPSEGS
jgi:hypothetical protein